MVRIAHIGLFLFANALQFCVQVLSTENRSYLPESFASTSVLFSMVVAVQKRACDESVHRWHKGGGMFAEQIAKFDDTEELSRSLRNADVRAMQINRGGFRAVLKRRFSDGWNFQFINFLEGVSSCAGGAAPDRHVFVVPLETVPGCRLLGGELSDASIGVYAPGGEHACITRGGLVEAVVAPPSSLLASAIENGDYLELPQWGARHSIVSEAKLNQFRTVLRRLQAIGAEQTASAAIMRSLNDSLATGLIALISEPEDNHSMGRTPMPRRPILNKIGDLMNEREGEILFASELAARAGVSHPTLQRVFLEWFGLPPARYLMLRRLYLARGRLRSGAYSTVSEVAESCGFVELSRFAKRYKAVFGELPSQTLGSRK